MVEQICKTLRGSPHLVAEDALGVAALFVMIFVGLSLPTLF